MPFDRGGQAYGSPTSRYRPLEGGEACPNYATPGRRGQGPVVAGSGPSPPRRLDHLPEMVAPMTALGRCPLAVCGTFRALILRIGGCRRRIAAPRNPAAERAVTLSQPPVHRDLRSVKRRRLRTVGVSGRQRGKRSGGESDSSVGTRLRGNIDGHLSPCSLECQNQYGSKCEQHSTPRHQAPWDLRR
jgi:hypothetical protein